MCILTKYLEKCAFSKDNALGATIDSVQNFSVEIYV